MKKAMHPGEFLVDGYLEPMSLSITELAKHINVSASSVSRLASGKAGVSAEMAVRLSKALNTTSVMWIKMQYEYDVSRLVNMKSINKIKPIKVNGEKNENQ